MSVQGKHAIWLFGVLVTGLGLTDARAQALPLETVPTNRVLLVDGERASWPSGSGDDVEAALRVAISEIQRDGYYHAELDSIVDDGSTVAVYVTRGPRFVLGAIEIEGSGVFSSRDLLALMQLRTGKTLDPVVLEDDIDALLSRYERAGYPLASIEVTGVHLLERQKGELGLGLKVTEGPAAVLRAVRVSGSTRATPEYVARLTGLRTGRALRDYRPEELRERLIESGIFSDVYEPELTMEPDSGAVITFEMHDNPPGAFDLAVGFLPPAGSRGKMSIAGNGHLVLNNLFGGGRTASLQLNRLPGQVSMLKVDASDPFIFGSPLAVSLSFNGLQQDSTFSKHRIGTEVGVRLARGVLGFVTISREVTEPGAAGAFTGASSISAGQAWFAGVGVRASRIDDRINPRRGFYAELAVESGRKSFSGALPEPGQESGGKTAIDQERVRASVRLYRPFFSRQVLVMGADAATVLSATYDESDLIRFGGAASLRGYDEERFRARTAGRALAEYRLLLDRQSHAFAFSDLGYVEAPDVPGVAPIRGFYPGYGIGMRLGTNLGLVTATYAVSSEGGPMNGRVHVGLSFGL